MRTEDENNESKRQTTTAGAAHTAQATVSRSALCMAIGELHLRIVVPPCASRRLGDFYPTECRRAIKRITRVGMSSRELLVPTRAKCLAHDGRGNIVRKHQFLGRLYLALYCALFVFSVILMIATALTDPSQMLKPQAWLLGAVLIANTALVYKTVFLPERLADRALALLEQDGEMSAMRARAITRSI